MGFVMAAVPGYLQLPYKIPAEQSLWDFLAGCRKEIEIFELFPPTFYSNVL